MAVANTFSGGVLDRAGAERTDPEWVAARAAEETSRALVVTSEAVLVRDTPDGGLALARVRMDADAEPILLGIQEDGSALFALDAEGVKLGSDDARLIPLREAGALLAHGDGGLAAYAVALVGWHKRHPHCAVCGARTNPADGGHVRRCPNCGAEHHPRTDPVVIMLVTDGDRALLGRQASWPPGRYSTLAGFVEPGESLEEAVAREVAEEASVAVTDVRYVSSQPWPFPGSLMLGFEATYAGGDARIGDRELEDVRWFSRAELEAAAAAQREREAQGAEAASVWEPAPGGELALPPPLAIARRLIDGWLARGA